MLRKIFDPVLTIAYPQSCAVCNNSVENSRNGVACEKCWRKTRIFDGTETICRKCGKLHGGKPNPIETYCRECDDQFYDLARSIGVYEFALSSSILNLKRVPIISKRVKNLIAETIERAPFEKPTLIVPVPLSKKRMFERGFNQAHLIAKILKREIGVPLNAESLIRTAHAKVHRAGMDRRGRELTVEKSFEMVEKSGVVDERILLVDDVFASGATASACAKVLKKNGASKVYVFTIARAA